MDIGSIFLILAILIPVAIFIGRPLLERSTSTNRQAEHAYSSLLAMRDQVVASLQEPSQLVGDALRLHAARRATLSRATLAGGLVTVRHAGGI